MLATWRRYKLTRWLSLVLLILMILLPLPQFIAPERKLVTNSLLFSFTQLFTLIWLASNWNAISGFTGYVDFGHAVFFGLGAYGTGVMMVKLDIPFVLAVIIGAIIAAVFAFLIGSATLRLKGPYFSIAMLGTFVAMREIVRIIKPITGGGSGLTLPPYLNRPLFYYVTLFGMAIVVLLIWLMRRTQFGASLIAIREDEVGAEMRGINTTRHKIIIFCLASFSTGFVGGLWAYQNTFIDPDIVFFESRTIELVMMTILGGLGTVAGPVVGATVLYWLRDIIWANFLDYHLIVQGVMLILIVLFVPEGIMGIIGDPDATSLGRLWKKHFGEKEEDAQPKTTTEVQP